MNLHLLEFSPRRAALVDLPEAEISQAPEALQFRIKMILERQLAHLSRDAALSTDRRHLAQHSITTTANDFILFHKQHPELPPSIHYRFFGYLAKKHLEIFRASNAHHEINGTTSRLLSRCKKRWSQYWSEIPADIREFIQPIQGIWAKLIKSDFLPLIGKETCTGKEISALAHEHSSRLRSPIEKITRLQALTQELRELFPYEQATQKIDLFSQRLTHKQVLSHYQRTLNFCFAVHFREEMIKEGWSCRDFHLLDYDRLLAPKHESTKKLFKGCLSRAYDALIVPNAWMQWLSNLAERSREESFSPATLIKMRKHFNFGIPSFKTKDFRVAELNEWLTSFDVKSIKKISLAPTEKIKAGRDAAGFPYFLKPRDSRSLYRELPPINTVRYTSTLPRRELQCELTSHVTFGYCLAEGKRFSMQDAVLTASINLYDDTNLMVFGVMDGHGEGAYIAEFIQMALPELLRIWLDAAIREANEFSKDEDLTIRGAMKLMMIELNNMIQHAFKNNAKHTGSTALFSFVYHDKIYTVNVGDSRAVLSFPDGRYRQLSEDANNGAELYKKSIQKRQREIINNRVDGVAVYRTFGDFQGRGLSAHPRIQITRLDEPCRIILVTDGVSDVIGTDNIASIVREQQRPGEAAHALAESAWHSGSEDNLSVVVADLFK